MLQEDYWFTETVCVFVVLDQQQQQMNICSPNCQPAVVTVCMPQKKIKPDQIFTILTKVKKGAFPDRMPVYPWTGIEPAPGACSISCEVGM